VIKIFIGLGVIIAAPLVVALFMKTQFTVEREVLINRPKQEVFNYVKHLKNQEHYTKWAAIDPKMKTTYRGSDGTVGFVSVWESDNMEVGKSEQEIKRIIEGERIDVEIRFKQPFQSTDPAYTTTESVGASQTKVTSGYTGKMRYPTNLMIFHFRHRIGKDMETNLANLKGILEGQ